MRSTTRSGMCTPISAHAELSRRSHGPLTAYEKLPSTADIDALRKKIDVEFLREDIPSLISESQEGITCVKKIVQDLKDFSRVDSSQEWQTADLHHGIDSTLNIVNNETAQGRCGEGEGFAARRMPAVATQPGVQNLLVNRRTCHGRGAWLHHHPLRELLATGPGWSLRTMVAVCHWKSSRRFSIHSSNETGGQGTGLGLSLTRHHSKAPRADHGAEPGRQGTVFRIEIPIAQPALPTETETEHV